MTLNIKIFEISIFFKCRSPEKDNEIDSVWGFLFGGFGGRGWVWFFFTEMALITNWKGIN